MISVSEATAIIKKHIRDFGIVEVPFQKAIGRILREDLVADRPFPPYDRVTMDGIAFTHSHYAKGKRTFKIEGIGAAGAPQLNVENNENCVEIMTGAMMPINADTVVRYEDVTIKDGYATINVDDVQEGKNIHRKGEDRSIGGVLIKAGKDIGPAEIGIATTIGRSTLKVSRLPKVIIISSGDELVKVDETPLPYQIRRSNAYQTQSLLKSYGIKSDTKHLPDDQETIEKELKNIFEEYEVVILSGGVSKGKFDYIPDALAKIGVNKHFHWVKERPGKPFWFGTHPKGVTVFALPGNPVSTFMCSRRYLLPWIQESLQIPTTPQAHAILAEDFEFRKGLTYFLNVKLEWQTNGTLLAFPKKGHGSGDHANLSDADAFMELPAEKDEFKQGEAYPVWMYR